MSASNQPSGWESADNSQQAGDPLGMAAIISGCIGIVTLGFVLAIVTAVLAAEAGRRARARGRSQENAYIAGGLAVLDGVVFLVLHYLFKLPAFAG